MLPKKYYQGLNKLFKPDEEREPVTIKKEKPERTVKSKLLHDSKYRFSDYRMLENIIIFLLREKMIYCSFYHRLNEFRHLVPRTKRIKIKRKSVYKNTANLYNTMPTIYFNDYNNITDE